MVCHSAVCSAQATCSHSTSAHSQRRTCSRARTVAWRSSPHTLVHQKPLTRKRPNSSSRQTTRIEAVSSDLDQLREKWEIPGLVTFAPGRGDLPCVKLQHSCGSTAEVYLYGANVVSWKQPTPGDNEYTRSMWPHAFKAVYAVTLHGELLRTDLRIINTGDKPFEFTAALHTYIEVLDINKATVKGLKDLEYLDKVKDPKNPQKQKEDRELIKFTGPTDSVYMKARDYVELDVGTGAAVSISSSGWEDVVVWSPWEAMKECYQKFACVENAKFNSPAVVQPGESWRAQQEFAVIDL
ncbi:hypothetical protein WJX79_006148 [Trebouxia sp. C0005]